MIGKCSLTILLLGSMLCAGTALASPSSYQAISSQALPQGDMDKERSVLQRDLLDLYTAQLADMKLVEDLLRQRLVLKDDVIDAQAERLLGLENSIESVKRLADARVEQEKQRCPRCPPRWARYGLTAGSFVVGSLAGRGSCSFGP